MAGETEDQTTVTTPAEAAVVETPVEVTYDQEFDDIFSQAIDLPAEAAPAKKEEPAATEATEVVEETPPAEAEVTEAVEETEPTAAAPIVETPTAKDPLDPAAIGKAIADAMQEQTKKATPAAEETAPALQDRTVADFISAEDKAVLDKYDTEWNEVSQANSILLKAHVAHAKYELINQVAGALAPIVSELNELKVTRQLDSIRAVHPDFETLVPKVKDWVNTVDELYRPALQKVMQTGTAPELIKLYDAYKKANPATAVPATPASSVAKKEPNVVAAVKVVPKAALAATAAVQSQRVNTPIKDDDDFDSALASALAL